MLNDTTRCVDAKDVKKNEFTNFLLFTNINLASPTFYNCKLTAFSHPEIPEKGHVLVHCQVTQDEALILGFIWIPAIISLRKIKMLLKQNHRSNAFTYFR